MADTTIGNDDISAVLPEGASAVIEKAGFGLDQLTVKQKIDNIKVAAKDGRFGVIGNKILNSDFEANPAKGEVSKFILENTAVVGTTVKNIGKGSLDVKVKTGNFKKNIIDAGKQKRDDVVQFGPDANVIKNDLSMGKGDDTVQFKKATSFRGNTSCDLGQAGTDVVIVKNGKGVTNGKLSITSFTRKDELKIGKTTFDYKDIKGGADLPGNIKVDLA